MVKTPGAGPLRGEAGVMPEAAWSFMWLKAMRFDHGSSSMNLDGVLRVRTLLLSSWRFIHRVGVEAVQKFSAAALPCSTLDIAVPEKSAESS